MSECFAKGCARPSVVIMTRDDAAETALCPEHAVELLELAGRREVKGVEAIEIDHGPLVELTPMSEIADLAAPGGTLPRGCDAQAMFLLRR